MSTTHTAVLLGLLVAFAGCSSHHSYLRISTRSAIAEQKGDGPTAVAWYRNGEIVGADGVGTESPFGDWGPSGPYVDHPGIPHWRRQLAELQSLAGKPETQAVQLARAARGFPFDQAITDTCGSWVGGRADRAADLLDHTGEVELGDAFAEQLAATATRDQPDDGRAAAWLHALTRADHDEAVVVLVASPATGPRTAEAALLTLDDQSSRHRATIFAAAARRLAADPAMADVIVTAADQMPTSEEARALAALLTGDASVELARQVLRHLDDRASSERARLFRQAALRCYRDPRSQFAIAGAMDDLPSHQRLYAARAVVELPEAPVTLVVMLVDLADTLRSSDREEFLLQVLDGHHGEDPDVRSACAEVARRHLSSRSRDRVLQRLGRR